MSPRTARWRLAGDVGNRPFCVFPHKSAGARFVLYREPLHAHPCGKAARRICKREKRKRTKVGFEEDLLRTLVALGNTWLGSSQASATSWRVIGVYTDAFAKTNQTLIDTGYRTKGVRPRGPVMVRRSCPNVSSSVDCW
jgi:hypothetical protein